MNIWRVFIIMRKKKRKKARMRKTHHTSGEFYQLCA
ncbi:unnamed protein product, partial [marine sediment metagenome]